MTAAVEPPWLASDAAPADRPPGEGAAALPTGLRPVLLLSRAPGWGRGPEAPDRTGALRFRDRGTGVLDRGHATTIQHEKWKRSQSCRDGRYRRRLAMITFALVAG